MADPAGDPMANQEVPTLEEFALEADIDPDLLRKEFPASSSYNAYLRIGNLVPNWVLLAEGLGLRPQEIQGIRSNLNLTDGMHAREVLRKWKMKNAFNATFWGVVRVYLEHGQRNEAKLICHAIREYHKSAQPNAPSGLNPSVKPVKLGLDDSPDNFPTFKAWLKHRGLSDRDIQTLDDEGFATAQGFATFLPEDINDMEVTKGGKRVLQQLITLVEKKKEENERRPQVSGVTHPSASNVGRVPSGASVLGSNPYTGLPQAPPRETGSRLRELNNDVDYSLTDCSNAYNTLVRCSVKLNYAMSQDPKSLALSLYSAGFISQSTLDETVELNETKSSKGSRLYGVVLGRVRNFPKKFADFIKILRRDRFLYGDVLAEIDRMYNTDS